MDINALMEENKKLKDEIKRLKKLLDEHHITYEKPQYNPVKRSYGYDAAAMLNSFFKGRKDIYARRVEKNHYTSYYPQCYDRWNQICPKNRNIKMKCIECPHRNFIPVNPKVYIDHLNGKYTHGIYPLLEDDKTFLLVFDFDDHHNRYEDLANKDNGWKEEVNALRQICKRENVPCLVERSRSGHGAHVWFIFEKEIDASLARRFGSELLTIGANYIDMKTFKTYDRMLPMQDHLQEGQIGNLIALPFQGESMLENNTCFVDENWEPYARQWVYLTHYPKIKEDFVKEKVKAWGVHGELGVLADDLLEDQPWQKDIHAFCKEDIDGAMHIILADGLYIDTSHMKPRMRNRIRRMAAFKNSDYNSVMGKGKRKYYVSRIIQTHKDGQNYIKIPRGLYKQLIDECVLSDISYKVSDQRLNGKMIHVSFQGELRDEQNEAMKKMLAHDIGILNAATGFGKTVVACAMIAERKVSTLIIVPTETLLAQWRDSLDTFLSVDEPLPTYTTKTGIVKTYKSYIGTLKGGQNKLTGIIDIAMMQSLKEDMYPLLDQYGMVIMDECHRCAGDQIGDALNVVRSRYVYGLSATPKRSDGLTPIIGFTFGPIRYTYASFKRAMEQSFNHYVYPRFTNVVNLSDHELALHEANDLIKLHKDRQEMICKDVIQVLSQHHTPLVLGKFVDQCEDLYHRLKGEADHVLLLVGNKTKKEKEEIFNHLKTIPDEKSVILIATIQLAGEGFDFPRADTIMLASPISYEGRTAQAIGRITRDYEGKQSSIVYDYIDIHIPVFERMSHKRMTTYKKNGFHIVSSLYVPTKSEQSFFDANQYQSLYDDDLLHANKEIVISSTTLSKSSVMHYTKLFKSVMERGVIITVLCLNPDKCIEDQQERQSQYIGMLKQAGIIVHTYDVIPVRYCVIDSQLIWYGDMNLLSNVKKDQVMLRYSDAHSASELLALSVSK